MPQVNEDSELVLGLITTVGTDVDGVISNIIDHLKKFKYSTEVITVSKDILTQFSNNVVPNRRVFKNKILYGSWKSNKK